ncbi:carboxylesterase [Pontibacillus halophilus JSM 076056 = DSM 19796]|uniref:Carboxylesterase n=1 Tax=Pontibacillus halophilus JSM 076056 = DSM 19796 TaxID=1385510 RepID=A0A0A5I420_9BACI|nr:alpha/beta fold hydrolase [Pontibacillus halophilus]KGX90562.1 carboxylesterase [Pontibacillus halophilus JSM 076056 = DSM 19796]
MIGCLLLHGYTGAPYEVEPLAQYLQEREDWYVSIPTLPGHGIEQMDHVPYTQWIEAAEKALMELYEECSTVYVVGFSMGGMIAAYLAANHKVDKLVLLSASAKYIEPVQFITDIASMARNGFRGEWEQDVLYKRYRHKVGKTPIRSVFEFRKCVQATAPCLSEIECPTYIVQGEQDALVPKQTAYYLSECIGDAVIGITFLANSKHLVCLDEDREIAFQVVHNFLQLSPVRRERVEQ